MKQGNQNQSKKKPATILVGGRNLPCRVTMGAMIRFKRETGHDVKEMRGDDIEEVVTFLWCCMASACRADRVTDIPDRDEFADSLEPETLHEFYSGAGMAAGSGTKKTVPPAAAPQETPAEA